MQNTSNWVTFHIEHELYAHAIKSIKEIIPYTDPSPLPGGDRATEGILNVRGDAITLFSARSLLDLSDEPPSAESHIIILEKEQQKIGVRVGPIGEIISFEDSQAEWHENSGSRDIISGTLNHHGQLVILLDLTAHSFDMTD